jgi:uncharacterized repeat protein (TIGR03803 family)
MPQHKADSNASARRIKLLLCFLSLLIISATQPAHAQTYSVLYNFTDKGSAGGDPYGGPILDQQGNLYGTTYLGGSYGSGSIYELSPSGSSWTYQTLYSLKGVTDGAGPGYGSVAFGPDHMLYATTEGGGYFGTAVAICDCPQKEYVVHRFGNGTDGGEPMNGVVFAPSGNFYGTTLVGGNNGNGAVFEIKSSGNTWIETSIYKFAGGADAINPVATVSIDAHGNLYGTAPAGGAYSNGAVYELSHSATGWNETVLYSFQGLSDGANPVGGVIVDPSGNLYGTTFDGGDNGGGVVYELSPNGAGWNFTVIYSLTGGYSGPYNKLTRDLNGNLYGTTTTSGASSLGTVFKLSPANGSWTFTDLYDFPGGNDGGFPYGALAVDANGNIFGTATIWGSDNQCVLFEITQ